MLLNLTNEKGNLYLKMLDFRNALKDFSFVLNHPHVNGEQKIEALWNRSKAYLATGKIRDFQHDCNQSEQLEASVISIEDNKDYAIFKIASYMLRDPSTQDKFITLLKIRREIQSEKDVTFTPSGLVIVRKLTSMSGD